MSTRLFTTYAAIILLLEGVAALAYTIVSSATDFPLSMQPYQFAIAAALVAAGAVCGLAMGYNESSPIDEGFAAGGIIAVVLFCSVGYCLSNDYHNAAAMIIATTVAVILGRLADWAVENIELNSYRVDFGRL